MRGSSGILHFPSGCSAQQGKGSPGFLRTGPTAVKQNTPKIKNEWKREEEMPSNVRAWQHSRGMGWGNWERGAGMGQNAGGLGYPGVLGSPHTWDGFPTYYGVPGLSSSARATCVCVGVAPERGPAVTREGPSRPVPVPSCPCPALPCPCPVLSPGLLTNLIKEQRWKRENSLGKEPGFGNPASESSLNPWNAFPKGFWSSQVLPEPSQLLIKC